MKKSRGGRPPKLSPDEATLKIIRGLGNIQATTRECAAFLEVTEPTYLKFKTDHPEVADAYRDGSGQGLVSLRRRQFKMAETNASMAIWLGKQYLGQVDKVEAGVKAEITVSDARSKLEDMVARIAVPATAEGGSGEPDGK